MKADAFVTMCDQTLLSTPQNRCVRERHPASCPTTSSGTLGKQFLFLDLQRPRQKSDLRVGHAAELSLDFGNRVFTNVPTDLRATRGEHGLRQSPAVADFSHDGTDNVLRNGLAHDFALTVCERGVVFLPISEGMERSANFFRKLCERKSRTWLTKALFPGGA